MNCQRTDRGAVGRDTGLWNMAIREATDEAFCAGYRAGLRRAADLSVQEYKSVGRVLKLIPVNNGHRTPMLLAIMYLVNSWKILRAEMLDQEDGL